jgi:hypothetical protein
MYLSEWPIIDQTLIKISNTELHFRDTIWIIFIFNHNFYYYFIRKCDFLKFIDLKPTIIVMKKFNKSCWLYSMSDL